MIKLGISACLLGQNVRYDGGHKHDRFLIDTLGRFVTFVPVCPEVECGFPVPREAMRLVGTADAPRLVTFSTKKDFTEQLTAWARKRVRELEGEDLCGFIFKSKSPSCGMRCVKLYNDPDSEPSYCATGLFARVFREHFPLVPCEENESLYDPMMRDTFLARVERSS